MFIINQKKILYLIAALVGLALLGLIYSQVKPRNPVPENMISIERQVLPENQLPNEFPKDFPLETGVQIVQNDNVKVEGKDQGRRQFVSQKTLEENYIIYKTYMTQTGWEIISDTNEATLKALIGRQANQVLTVSISKNSISGKVFVNAAMEY